MWTALIRIAIIIAIFVLALYRLGFEIRKKDGFVSMIAPNNGKYRANTGYGDESKMILDLKRYPVDERTIFVTNLNEPPGNISTVYFADGYWWDKYSTKGHSTADAIYWANGNVWERISD